MRRVGIVGAGNMGRWHASRWNQLPVELVGYYDLVREQAVTAADRYGGRVYDSLDALLRDVDIVDVCTSTPGHAQPAIAAARAGKHIVCEKPLARHLADGEAIIAACREAGVRLFVAQVVRFFPEFAGAKAELDSGRLGQPGVVRTVRGGSFPGANSWYNDFELSGGVILDLAIHDIDYLRWLCGDVTRVFARGLSFSGIDATDHVLITLRFANGAIGHVEGSWAFPAGTFRTFLEIAGSEGVLQHDSLGAAPLVVQMHEHAVAEGGKVTIPGGMLADEDDPYYRELEHFLDCLETGEEFLVAPEDGLQALKISLAAIESVRTGRVVELARFEEAR